MKLVCCCLLSRQHKLYDKITFRKVGSWLLNELVGIDIGKFCLQIRLKLPARNLTTLNSTCQFEKSHLTSELTTYFSTTDCLQNFLSWVTDRQKIANKVFLLRYYIITHCILPKPQRSALQKYTVCLFPFTPAFIESVTSQYRRKRRIAIALPSKLLINYK